MDNINEWRSAVIAAHAFVTYNLMAKVIVEELGADGAKELSDLILIHLP